ncbi:MAG: sugar phosphate isomerase/epimerase [Lentisphaerae bacterium]|nr:sugar phosphate isomerase/epimerase [Lentisphaerota bacterium]
MKIGFTSYSFSQAVGAGTIDFLKSIEVAAEYGAEHIEIARDLSTTPELIEPAVATAKAQNLEISSYTIGANFVQPDAEAVKKEVERVKGQIEIGAKLGVTRMRHDCGWRPIPEATVEQFEKELPLFVDCCGELADYAAKYGITTSIENHGFYVQGSERVKRIVLGVNRANFRTTLDVGNFLCVDEDPVSAVMNNISIASMIHFKDFHIKRSTPPTEAGYIKTAHGNYLRGALTGDGDVDLKRISKIINESGYDGCLSIEFEGWEESLFACSRAIKNVKALMRG